MELLRLCTAENKWSLNSTSRISCVAQQSTAITCNLNGPNPLLIYPEQPQQAEIYAPLQKEICPPGREPLSADEWLQSVSIWIVLFPWEKHSAKARSSICAQQGGFDCHRGTRNTPKQKPPTRLQGLFKRTLETGQLKMSEGELN